MRVFVTGASGFVGSAVVKELLGAGHEVLGLVRSDKGAEQLASTGAEVYRGDVNDLEFIQKGVAECDAVIHTAFNHDFSQFKANCEADRKVIEALGDALTGTDKPMVITSGVGLLNYGRLATEDDVPPAASDAIPRVASEEAAATVAAKGVKVYTVRLPPSVHGEGNNRWPAVHRSDAAILYRLIVEKQPALRVLHAVDEEGIEFRKIAEAIGQGLNLPVLSKTGDEAAAHFGWFLHFASMNCPSSSEKTRTALNWLPKATGLIADIGTAGYLKK
jgi:nucleoside-diphosphate-sugar epimerase